MGHIFDTAVWYAKHARTRKSMFPIWRDFTRDLAETFGYRPRVGSWQFREFVRGWNYGRSGS